MYLLANLKNVPTFAAFVITQPVLMVSEKIHDVLVERVYNVKSTK